MPAPDRTTPLMNDWNIQSRSHHCQSCQAPFSDREKYHTVLTDEQSDYLRLDVCEKCWQAHYAEGAKERKGFISYWQGVYEAPPPTPPEAIRRDDAESLLRKLIEQNDPQYSAAAFILAVMLERKRQLKVKEQFQREGRRVFIYEQAKTGDLFTITDPDLQLNQLDAVQHQVAQLLEQGLNPSVTDAVASAGLNGPVDAEPAPAIP